MKLEQLEAILLGAVKEQFADKRLHIFDVQIAALDGDVLRLSGRVLDSADLELLKTALVKQFPGLQVEHSQVRIMRKEPTQWRTVNTNLTSLHKEPSWLAEQVTQLLYGIRLEVLEEKDRWGFVRQEDGYLGWVYLPYLTDQPAPTPTHLVTLPLTIIRAEPNPNADMIGRLLGGTLVQVPMVSGNWVEVDTFQSGWVPRADVRALTDMPHNEANRRSLMVSLAARMMGVQYLWGGCTVSGIDCSGLTQLAHRWVGIRLPRDADMQFDAGEPVEPPFQPGDLLFFGEMGERRSITHVAISLGDWKILHSSRAHNGVYMDDIQTVEHLRESFVGACTFMRD